MQLEQLPSGRWRAVVQHKGRKRSTSPPSDTRELAQIAGANLLIEMGAAPPPHIRPTLGELVTAHLDRTNPKRAPGTRANRDRFRRAIPDDIGSLDITQLKAMDIEAIYNRLEDDGVAPHTLLGIHHLIRGAYSEGARLYGLASPMDDVEPPETDPGEMTVPTREQVQALIAAGRTTQEKLAVRLAATSGARRGELVAARWDMIDLEAGRWRILTSHAYTPDEGIHERDTKTGRKGQRVISLDAQTVADLEVWRNELLKRAADADMPDPVYVFSYDLGATAWRPDRLTAVFGEIRGLADVTGVRLQDLRHFMATEMLTAGVPLHVVSQRLGHSTVTTTARVYAHWIVGADGDAAEGLGGLI